MSSTIEVRIDDRLRLAGALLAASDWPAYEQTVKAYKPHRAADYAHKQLAAHSGHPAAQGARALVGNGEGLTTLYTHALTDTWPASIPVADFKTAANLDAFWAETAADWQAAETEAREVITRADLGKFIDDLLGAQTRKLVFMPNIIFPGRQWVGCHSEGEVVIALHPPMAWGESHPWKYNERPDEVMAKLSEALAQYLFLASVPEMKAHAEAFGLAAAVLFLRQAEDEAAGNQYMVMEKKTRGIKHLPAVVAALEPLLADRRAGKYASVAEYAGQLVGAFPA